ncbi:hypothetical protein COT94_03400 [Candidatus Falkowbacteria bacterium CG10_big_fil_rev_8_21_14_0_10_37_14]|uniref:Rod shape-determining protein RodA n=1 Tax=Candidatus Falkowbacteria bacterium CG10_big_fil_rev_8_21_14_0_10_37_14 TaxID=1974561 RepID=A0A2M6WSX7_9BACT|nr:rod shape-determining protein RodA [Candidatus Falkowbacteria bacterium]PIT95865.1 MAG: hypothetical protein COT94_03400 [Candidatus Falkowbacteria bacterium CG10_big_fil_rev_8_21_14_0_10_37_14]
MALRVFNIFKHLDWLMLLPVVLLSILGLSELYSMDVGQSGRLFEKQLTVLLLGLVMVAVVIWLDYYFWYSFGVYFYFLSLLLLAIVLLFGSTINNTKGWFEFGFGNFQPVELAKVSLIIILARYFSKANPVRQPFRTLCLSALLALGPIILVMFQPDLGSAAILGSIWLLLLILAGWPRKFVIILASIAIFTSVFSWPLLAAYQKDRIVGVFLNRSGSLTSNYNVNQAIIAVGSGQSLGRGLGYGSQSQLRFLPEAKNDFIFAVIAEELGFLGVMAVISCFVLIFWRIIANLPKIKDNFGIFFLLGFGVLIFLQMFINIGMNLGLLPVVGITLPFLSYGGSSLSVNLLLFGIAQSIIARSKLKNY